MNVGKVACLGSQLRRDCPYTSGYSKKISFSECDYRIINLIGNFVGNINHVIMTVKQLTQNLILNQGSATMNTNNGDIPFVC